VADILQEYLVKLGFNVDTTAFSQFQNTLRDASSIVDNQYTKMAKTVLGFQGVATGAFLAAGVAALDIAGKVASADQEYRLLALHMYTSLPVARELKIALDALGQPLENVMYDPELARRFNQLVKDQRALTRELGPDFEKQMLKIRDVRFEFTRFGVELQYLTMNVVQDLALAFGVDMDQAFGKIRNFNEWFIQHMPEISQWLANNLKPILVDVKDVTLDTVEAVKAGSVVFANLIGILANDQSLEGTAFSFDKIARSIENVVHWLRKFLGFITAEEVAVSHYLNALNELTQGHLGTAASEFKAAIQAEHPVSGAIQKQLGLSTMQGGYDQAYVPDVIARMAHILGVDPKLALAVAQQESGFRQYDAAGNILRSKTGALGIMQLLPSTAKGLGVDPNDPGANIIGGITYLQQLLSKYGSPEQALEHYYGSKDAAANASYAHQVMGREAGIQIDGGLHVTIQAKTDASAKDIASAMNDVLHDLATKKRSEIQRNLAEQQTGSWGYAPSY
jgi:hypothetical protein